MGYNDIEYAQKAIEANAKGLILFVNGEGDIELLEPFVTKEDIINQNKYHRDSLLDEVNEKITILKRAVKYDLATILEKERLEKLEIYTVLLNRIDLSEADVEFPHEP